MKAGEDENTKSGIRISPELLPTCPCIQAGRDAAKREQGRAIPHLQDFQNPHVYSQAGLREKPFAFYTKRNHLKTLNFLQITLEPRNLLLEPCPDGHAEIPTQREVSLPNSRVPAALPSIPQRQLRTRGILSTHFTSLEHHTGP